MTPVLLSCGSTDFASTDQKSGHFWFCCNRRRTTTCSRVAAGDVCPLLPGGLKASRHHPQAVTACVLMPKMAWVLVLAQLRSCPVGQQQLDVDPAAVLVVISRPHGLGAYPYTCSSCRAAVPETGQLGKAWLWPWMESPFFQFRILSLGVAVLFSMCRTVVGPMWAQLLFSYLSSSISNLRSLQQAGTRSMF